MTEAEVREIVQQMILDNEIRTALPVRSIDLQEGRKMNANNTFGEFAQAYVDDYKVNIARPSTITATREALKAVAKTAFNDIQLDKVTLLDGQKLVNDLVALGLRTGTVEEYIKKVKAVFNFAVENDLLTKNPIKKVHMPKKGKTPPPKDVSAYTDEEQDKLNYTMSCTHLTANPVVQFILAEGTRIGETLALTWDDIDLDNLTVNIWRTIAKDEQSREYVQDYPKTESSIRKIPLSSSIVPMLSKMKEGKNHDDFVFVGQTGKRLMTRSILDSIQVLCKKAGVPYKGSHVFRHTFATNAYRNGADVKSLSRMLGHANVQITYNTYINLFGDGIEDMRKFVG